MSRTTARCSVKTFVHSGSTGTLVWADPLSKLSFVLWSFLPKKVSGELLLKPVAECIGG